MRKTAKKFAARIIALLALAAFLLFVWHMNHCKTDVLYSGLFVPATSGDADMARSMIRRGLDVNQSEPQSKITPLHIAAGLGKTDVARLLIENGANINARDINGMTPLHEAARVGCGGIVTMILAAGVEDIDARNRPGFTPLHMAAMWGYTEIAAILLVGGADPWLEVPDGMTAGELAASKGSYGTAIIIGKYMLAHPRKIRQVA